MDIKLKNGLKARVITSDKKIQDIKTGDYVLSFDIEDSSNRINEVLAEHLPIVDTERQIELIMEDESSFTTSVDHPMCFFSEENKWEYKKSGDVNLNDLVRPLGGGSTKVIKINRSEEVNADKQFYDITVDRDNNYYAGDITDKMVVVHNSATVYLPFWHKEIRDVLVLKNNKGTDDNRVRKLDYGIQFCRLFYNRFVKNENITLFSPADVPDLYESFGIDNDKFEELYEKYENDKTISSKTVKARDIFNQFIQERIGTGRMYVMNIDHANDHSSFKDKIYMSNLCLDGETLVKIRTIDISEDLNEKYNLTLNNDGYNYGEMNMKDVVELFDQIYIESYRIGNQVAMRSNGKIEVLSMNTDNLENEYKSLIKAAKTGENRETIEIYDDVNDIRIICTPDHPIYTINRGYVKAIDLKENDELTVLNNESILV
jgi:hypothetical protein